MSKFLSQEGFSLNTKSRNIASFVLGFFIMLFSGVFYAWSLFWQEQLRFQDLFSTWTKTQTTLTFSFFIIAFCLGCLFGGKLIAKFGQPRVARIGAVFMLAGSLLSLAVPHAGSSTAALWLLYLSYSILCGLGVGMVYNAVISGVPSLFPKIAGLVSGALLTGFGLGSLVMGKIVVKLAGATGFFPAFFIGILLVCLASFFGAPLLKSAQAKPAADGAPAADGSRDYTTAQMLKTPIFWLFFLWVVFMTSGGLMVIGSAAGIAVRFGATATVGMIVSVFNGLSRTAIGSFCDRFGSSASMILTNVIGILSCIFLLITAFSENTALMVLGLICTGITYGCAMSMNAVVIRKQFGNTYYPSNFSVVTLSGILAAFTPFFSGFLQDSSGGEYTTTFIAMIVFSVIGAAMLVGFLVCQKKAKK